MSFRRATRSATVALISAGGRGSSRYSTRATTSPGRERGVPVREPELVGRQPRRRRPPRRRARGRGRPTSRGRTRRRSCARRRRPFRGSRTRTRSPRGRRRARDGGRPRSSRHRPPRATRRRRPRPPASSPSSRSTSASTPVVGGEHVRAEPDDEHVEPLVRGEAQRLAELGDRARPRERTRRTARADRRQPRERDAVLDRRHAGSPSTTARAIRHGSPTPSVTTTSPGRAQASASVVASSSVGAQPRRTPRGHVVEHELAGDARERRVTAADARRSRRPRPRARAPSPSSWWSWRVRS